MNPAQRADPRTPDRVRPVAGRALLAAGFIGISGCAPAPSGPREALRFVVTQVPAEAFQPARFPAGPDGRFPDGTRVVLAFAGAAPAEVVVLSKGLLAAGGPAVSRDGRRVLFAGKKTAGSRWEVYEASLRDAWSRPRMVAQARKGAGADCADPAYLAGGRIVFSAGSGEGTWALYAASLEGGSPERITFGPVSASDPSPLLDGRLLFSAVAHAPGRRRKSPQPGSIHVLNPDGTWPEAFAAAHPPASAPHRSRETGDSGVVFLSADPGGRGRVERVEMRRPMVRRRTLRTGLADVFSAEPLARGGLLLSGRGTSRGVFRWREGGLAELVFEDPAFVSAEAVPLIPSAPLKGRPSEVVPGKGSGTLLCYDADRSDGVVGPRPAGGPKAARVEVLAWRGPGEASLGSSPVEEDGSFLIEVPSDLAVKVRTLDAKSRAISTSGWFWLRSGESRSCIGCHEGHEAMAPNRLLRALRRDPRRLEPGP